MILVRAIGGSRLYGTHTEQSDYDIRGVFVEHLSSLLFDNTETIQLEPDITYHSLKKFGRLIMANNPSALELLFTPDTYITSAHPYWNRMIALRQHVLSQRAVKSYGGFLTSQLQKFARDSSDRKAIVHAYRLSVQLQDIVQSGTFNPVLPEYIRTQVQSIYAGEEPDRYIQFCTTILQEAKEEAKNLPKEPNESHIKGVITGIYREVLDSPFEM